MKMLLTSGGIQNQSIHNALLDLLGKPIAECNALAITTASYGHPMVGPDQAYAFIAGTDGNPMVNLGWKSVGVLELSVLSSLPRDQWLPWLEEADVLLVNGGETMFLCHWLKETGLAEMLPTLDIVWVGLSAGSVVMAPRIGKQFVHWPQLEGDDHGLGFIDFAIIPHLEHPAVPDFTLDNARKWAAALESPCYAIDEDTAIKIVDDTVEVISEGRWYYFESEEKR